MHAALTAFQDNTELTNQQLFSELTTTSLPLRLLGLGTQSDTSYFVVIYMNNLICMNLTEHNSTGRVILSGLLSIHLVNLVKKFLPSHQQLHLGLALVSRAQLEEGAVQLYPGKSWNVVTWVEHLASLLQQVLQCKAVVRGRLHRLPEVVVQLLNRIGSLEKPGMQELVSDI